MGGKENKVNMFLSNLVVKRKSKDILHGHKAVFCENGKSIIICHGKSCHLYNTSTGNHLRKLFKTQNNIVSFQIHPLDEFLLIAVTENGEVTIYNLKTHQIDHSTNLTLQASILNSQKISKFNYEKEEEKEFDWNNEQINSLDSRKFLCAETKAFQGKNSKILIWASWRLNDEIQAHVSVFNLHDGKHKIAFSLRKSRLKNCSNNFVLSKAQKMDLFLGLSNHCLHVVYFEKEDSYFYSARKHYTGLTNTLTCLAVHPGENVVATGDSIGRIIIWKNIFDKYPLKEIFHWHCSTVHDVVFSKFGHYLFSGGEENVLVKWSLTAKKKQFLPRLSSAILFLSEASEASLLSVLTSDNKISILDFNFQFVSVIQNFSKWCTLRNKERESCNIFTMDPRSDCIVLNGKTGHLQFLSTKDEGKLLYVFDVTNRNFITSHRQFTAENTEVTHAVFNLSGDWLITAENRKESACVESRLKFWKYHGSSGTYMLNTNIEFPHEGDEIYSLEMSSNGMAATTGPDKKFRLWTVDEHQVGSVTKEIWTLYADRKYRNHECYAVDFCKDSSLVAVTFSSILTIWETKECVLRCSLSSPTNKRSLKACKFGNCEFTHMVIVGTESDVCCWNTITLTMVWSVPFGLSILVGDPYSVYLAAFSNDSTLAVFSPASPAPDLLVKKVSPSPVVAARCGSNGSGRFCLFFLNSDRDLYCLGGKAEKAEDEEANVEDGESSNVVTPFAAQIPQSEANGGSPATGKLVAALRNSQKSVTDLLNSPAHTLSNPSLLCSQILKGLVFVSVQSRSRELGRENEINNSQEKIQTVQMESKTDRETAHDEVRLSEIVETIFSNGACS